MSLLNRKRYAALWLYNAAKIIDEWPGQDYSGTSVRAGLDVVRAQGHIVTRGMRTYPLNLNEGIIRNRWAESVGDMIAAMHSPRYLKLGRAPFLNSWGCDYKHLTWMPLETIDRLLHDDGELAVIFDRTEDVAHV